jgi:myo-inositol-1(or 4)-monophosphatase
MFSVTLPLEHAGRADRGRDFRSYAERNFLERALEDTLAAMGFRSLKRKRALLLSTCDGDTGVRRAGSAALDLAYVTRGRLDGFWEFGMNPRDIAAGILLIGEAGGKCSDMRGGPVALHDPHLLADNGLVHEGTLGVFDDVFRGKYRYPIPVIK